MKKIYLISFVLLYVIVYIEGFYDQTPFLLSFIHKKDCIYLFSIMPSLLSFMQNCAGSVM